MSLGDKLRNVPIRKNVSVEPSVDQMGANQQQFTGMANDDEWSDEYMKQEWKKIDVRPEGPVRGMLEGVPALKRWT